MSGGVSSTGGSSIGPVVVVLLEIITVPLLNSGMSVLLEIITVPLLNSVTSGGSSTVVVVLLEIIAVPSLNSGISERSPAGGVAGGP